ncbi:hypothetical protein ACWE42_07525 [Sutcliffiella cohnii]
MEQLQPNSLLQSIFKGLSKKTEPKIREEYAIIETSPYLHSSDYLTGLFGVAKNKVEEDCILQHLYNHDAFYIHTVHDDGTVTSEAVETYQKLEREIINGRWKW